MTSKLFEPSYFFDLSLYEDSVLFDGCSFVWEALTKITSYLESCRLGIIKGEVSPQAYLIYPEQISIGEGTIVEPGAYIKGPCKIGKNCVIRHGAYIRGHFICGDGCVIGHDTEIKEAIFLDKVHAAHFAYVGNSILGNEVNLGAGTKCANLMFNRSTVKVRSSEVVIDSGLKKLGAIMGDRAQTGCNSVTNPGVLLGKGSMCYPNTTVSGFIPSGHWVVPSTTCRVRKRREG